MTTPHKHADLIHAFAEGKAIQYKTIDMNKWNDWMAIECPSFHQSASWRIKPDEPKKAVIATMLYPKEGNVLHRVVGSDDYNRCIGIGWTHLKELDVEITLPKELK